MYKFVLLIGFIYFLSLPSHCFAWWQYKVDQDKMTDEVMSVMTWTINRRSRVILGVGCRPESNPKYRYFVRYGWYSAKYHWGTEKAKKDFFQVWVEYRIDKNLPVKTYWGLDPEGSFPVIEKTVSPKDSLLIGLIKGQNVTFRLHDPVGNLQDVTFSLSGSGKQIHRVINACK